MSVIFVGDPMNYPPLRGQELKDVQARLKNVVRILNGRTEPLHRHVGHEHANDVHLLSREVDRLRALVGTLRATLDAATQLHEKAGLVDEIGSVGVFRHVLELAESTRTQEATA